MSRQLVRAVMPDSYRLLERTAPGVLDSLMPLECEFGPVPAPIYFAFPSLIPLALLGAVIGFWGCQRLRSSGNRNAARFWYKRSLAGFGGMNVAAIACHCFTPPDSPLKPLLIALDVGFTCFSSACLCAGALLGSHTTITTSSLHQRAANLLLPTVLCIAIAGNYHQGAVPFVNELLYIGTTTAAAALLWLREGPRHSNLTPQQRRALQAGAACYSIFFPAAGLLPRHLCRLLPGQVDAMAILFLCCDAAFGCVLRFLLLRQEQATRAAPRTITAAAAGDKAARWKE